MIGAVRGWGRAGGGAGRAGRLAIPATLAGLLLAGLPRPAHAAEGPNYARVRHVEGVLTAERPSRGETVPAGLNRPIAPGDRIHGPVGRGEIELADSSLVWVDHGSVVEFRTLADYDGRQERTNLLVLQRGRLRVETRDPGEADAVFQIDTEAGSVYLLSAGSFRVEAEGGVTTLASFGGVAEFSGDDGSVLVRSSQSSSVPVGGAPTVPRRFNTARGDAFDRYHDRRMASYAQDRDVGWEEGDRLSALPAVIAPYARELAFHGTWHALPPYGLVWRPHYSGPWSPYFHGSWGWYPAGWVWMSLEPWGWAPYRYGRWGHAATVGWFWIPGTAWSGAWVGFAVGPTHIGWCPLNYWNRPVFHDTWTSATAAVEVNRLDARGWGFTLIEQFGRPAPASPVVRGDRLARGGTLVVTRTLPHFDPPAIARRSGGSAGLADLVRRHRVALPSPRPGGEPVSFRVEEGRMRRAQESGGPGRREARGRAAGDERPAAPSRPPRETGSAVVATPPPVPRGAPPKDSDKGRGKDAVGRLVDGARATPRAHPPAAAGGSAEERPAAADRKTEKKRGGARPPRPEAAESKPPEQPAEPDR